MLAALLSYFCRKVDSEYLESSGINDKLQNGLGLIGEEVSAVEPVPGDNTHT